MTSIDILAVVEIVVLLTILGSALWAIRRSYRRIQTEMKRSQAYAERSIARIHRMKSGQLTREELAAIVAEADVDYIQTTTLRQPLRQWPWSKSDE